MRGVRNLQLFAETWAALLFVFAFLSKSPALIATSAALALLLLGMRIGLSLGVRFARKYFDEISESLLAAAAGRERRVFFGTAPFEEAASLSLNETLGSLRKTLALGSHEIESQAAVLGSMTDAVLVLDSNNRIKRLNSTALKLFGPDLVGAIGKQFHEVIPYAALHEFIEQIQAAEGDREAEIELMGCPAKSVRVWGEVLREGKGSPIGLLLLISDRSRIKHLENIRRDFIANVSHELKTPITAITGSVETLLDGAIDHPEDSRKFFGIVARQAARLSAIFDELLALSKIEFGGEQGEMRSREEDAAGIISAAIETITQKAEAKKVEICAATKPGVRAFCSAILVEQAVINLLDNAIRHSPEDSRVRVSAWSEKAGVFFAVSDSGPGIDEIQQGRIFERFYRIDPGRARADGGTGLGLAIVKHIAEAHGGSASVKSKIGEGSVFTMFIPHPAEPRAAAFGSSRQ